MSVNTNRMKTIAFMLSSGLAGIAGGLFAHILGYVNPGSFTIMKSTEVLVMVYLGGMGSLTGSVLAACSSPCCSRVSASSSPGSTTWSTSSTGVGRL